MKQNIHVHSTDNLCAPAPTRRYAKREAIEFEAMRKRGVTVHLDGDPVSDWRHFVDAKVLVMAKSSFSHVPAILSRNCVVYDEFWHFRLERWLLADTLNATLPRCLAG